MSRQRVYAATFHDYMRRELKWDTYADYIVTARVQPWERTEKAQVANVFRAAMASRIESRLSSIT